MDKIDHHYLNTKPSLDVNFNKVKFPYPTTKHQGSVSDRSHLQLAKQQSTQVSYND